MDFLDYLFELPLALASGLENIFKASWLQPNDLAKAKKLYSCLDLQLKLEAIQ